VLDRPPTNAKVGSEACSAKRTLTIVRIRSLLNYSEHCRLKASAREQSRVLVLLNRPQVWRWRSRHFLLTGHTRRASLVKIRYTGLPVVKVSRGTTV
jgi:hypothetical protein